MTVEPDFESANYYVNLGLSPDATPADISKAYRSLARKHHPDKNIDNTQEATRIFQTIVEAYSVLSNPVAREAYDDDGKEGVDDYEDKQQAQAGASSQDGGEDADPVFHRPVSAEEATAYYAAMFGEYQEQVYTPGAWIGFPYAEELRESYLGSELPKKLTFQIRQFKIVFFFTLLVKKRFSPVFTVVEFLCTWVAILTWLAVLADSDNVTARYVGGVAIFLAMAILHFWYGFLRYPSISRCCASDDFSREAKDDNFNDTRDSCSVLLYGDDKRRPQLRVIILTLPFSALNHFCAFVTSLACCCLCHLTNEKKYIVGGTNWNGSRNIYGVNAMSNDDISGSSGVFGILMVLVLFPILFIWAGSIGATWALACLLLNQHLYNAMLFRKRFRDFLLSLVFGNLFVITEVDNNYQPPPGSKTLGQSTRDLSQSIGRSVRDFSQSVRAGVSAKATSFRESRQRSRDSGNSDAEAGDKSSDDMDRSATHFDGDSNETPDDVDVCFDDKDHPGTATWRILIHRSVQENPGQEYSKKTERSLKNHFKGARYFTGGREASQSFVNERFKECFYQEKESMRGTGYEGDDVEMGTVDGTERAVGLSLGTGAGAPDDFDVCFDDAGHAGTMACRIVVQSTVDQFPGEKYSKAVEKAIIAQLETRRFFINGQPASNSKTKKYLKLFFAEEKEKLTAQRRHEAGMRLQEVRNSDCQKAVAILQAELSQETACHDQEANACDEAGSTKTAIATHVTLVPDHGIVENGVVHGVGVELTGVPSSGEDKHKTVRVPTRRDICFDIKKHPGTKAWRHTVRDSMEEFGGDDYSAAVFKAIKTKLAGRRYFIHDIEATRKEVAKRYLKLFVKEQGRWTKAQLSGMPPYNEYDESATETESEQV